jgi:plastocyanin
MMRRPPHVASLLVAAALTFGISACGGGDGGGSATPGQVSVVDNAFKPAKTTVAPGDTVTWTWNGKVSHNVTPIGDNRSEWKASKTQKDGTYDVTFEKAGTYQYLCTLHAGMKGTVTVS